MDEQLKGIVDRIVEFLHPTQIYLFGSRARGDHRPDSDYDIVVIYDGEKSKREATVGIYGLFHRPAFAMDVFILNTPELERFQRIVNTLEYEITHFGELLYG